ncbi:MAG: redoxin domain-containing protein, partial [Planctomycetota bacterium]
MRWTSRRQRVASWDGFISWHSHEAQAVPGQSLVAKTTANVVWLIHRIAVPLGMCSTVLMVPLLADDSRDAESSAAKDQTAATLDLSEEVSERLIPLFASISDAEVSRATVRLSAETVMNGVVVETEESTYQIASREPDRYTIYYKTPTDRRRIYCDGTTSLVALDVDAFMNLSGVIDNQSLVDQLPIDLGTYPEPVLSLALAGVDPAYTFLAGMKRVDFIEKTQFRGRVDSYRFRGVQNDGVTWDLWITTDPSPKPLRLLLDLTPMLRATRQVAVPEGYGHSLRYDFISWRIAGEVEDKLFRYAKPKGAREFPSIEAFKLAQANQADLHPLLGTKAPQFELTMLDGSKVTSDQLKGKLVVLDFWSTWCSPCIEAMPTIAQSCKRYANKGVVFIAVNVGEFAAHVKGFTSQLDWKIELAVDPKGEFAETFEVSKIPLTLLIAPSGIIEAAHVGFPGTDELARQFDDEFKILLSGG